MRVLVISASRLGSTHEIAERIGWRLSTAGLDVQTMDAATAVTGSALDAGDAYVIGSAVYAGHWLPSALHLVREHRHVLAARPVWLFSSGPVGDTATRYPPADPKDVAQVASALHPREHRTFAGALDRERVPEAHLGRVERFVATHLVPEGDYRDWMAIDRWADDIARDLRPTAERYSVSQAGVAEQADAADLNSAARKGV